MAEINCRTGFDNMIRPCKPKPYGAVYSLLMDADSDGIADEATALLEATWTTKINATVGDRTLVLKDPFEITWENGEAKVVEGNMDLKRQIAAGARRLTFVKDSLTRVEAAAIKKLNGATRYVYLVTTGKYIFGASSNGTLFQGMEVKISVDNEIQPNGVAETWKLNIVLEFVDPDGMCTKVVAPYEQDAGAWNPKSLDGIVDVEFTKISGSASSVVVDCTGVWDGQEVTGLVTADFLVTGLTSVEASGNRYTLTPTTTFTSPLSVTLKNQPTMTTKGFECQTALSVTWS